MTMTGGQVGVILVTDMAAIPGMGMAAIPDMDMVATLAMDMAVIPDMVMLLPAMVHPPGAMAAILMLLHQPQHLQHNQPSNLSPRCALHC